MTETPAKFCARCHGTTAVKPRKVARKTLFLCRPCRSVLKAIRKAMGESCPF